MIRVTIELISAQDGRRETLGVMDICNDGTGAHHRGNYDGVLHRKGVKPGNHPSSINTRRGRVENWPRKSYVIWRLVLRMLRAMYPEEK